MSLVDGQNANQTTFNNAFMSRTADDATTGKKSLQNADSASGANVVNAQREINSLNAFSGRSAGTAHDATPTWTNNDVGTSGDDLKDRAEALTQAFDSSIGHTHDGSAGSGGPLVAAGSGVAGVVSIGTQIISGLKTFEDGLTSDEIATFNSILAVADGVSFTAENSTVTGSLANAGPYSNVVVRLTDAGLVSIQNIDPANTKFLVLRNVTGASILLVNNTGGTASNRIVTGTGTNITLQNNAQIFLVYDSTESRWVIVGGSGSGGSGDILYDLSAVQSIAVTAREMYDASGNATLLWDSDSTSNVQVVNSLLVGGDIDMTGDMATGPESFVKFKDTTNAFGVSVKAPATVTADYTLQLPPAQGASNTYLKNDGSGVLSWSTVAFTTQNFTGTTITATASGFQRHRYTGGSAQTVTTISGGSLVDCETILIVGTSDTNTVALNNNDVSGGWLLSATWVGGRGDTLQIQWDDTLDRFVEISRKV